MRFSSKSLVLSLTAAAAMLAGASQANAADLRD